MLSSRYEFPCPPSLHPSVWNADMMMGASLAFPTPPPFPLLPPFPPHLIMRKGEIEKCLLLFFLHLTWKLGGNF